MDPQRRAHIINAWAQNMWRISALVLPTTIKRCRFAHEPCAGKAHFNTLSEMIYALAAANKLKTTDQLALGPWAHTWDKLRALAPGAPCAQHISVYDIDDADTCCHTNGAILHPNQPNNTDGTNRTDPEITPFLRATSITIQFSKGNCASIQTMCRLFPNAQRVVVRGRFPPDAHGRHPLRALATLRHMTHFVVDQDDTMDGRATHIDQITLGEIFQTNRHLTHLEVTNSLKLAGLPGAPGHRPGDMAAAAATVPPGALVFRTQVPLAITPATSLPSTLTHFNVENAVFLTDEAVAVLCAQCTQMEAINLIGCVYLTDNALKYIGNSLAKTLTKLAVGSIDFTPAGISTGIGPLTNLKQLEFNFEKADNMTHASLTNRVDFDIKSFMQTATFAPTLEHLTLTSIDVQTMSMLSLAQTCPRIQHIALKYVAVNIQHTYEYTTLCLMIQRMTMLKHIEILFANETPATARQMINHYTATKGHCKQAPIIVFPLMGITAQL